jgi:hypothetical protein
LCLVGLRVTAITIPLKAQTTGGADSHATEVFTIITENNFANVQLIKFVYTPPRSPQTFIRVEIKER